MIAKENKNLPEKDLLTIKELKKSKKIIQFLKSEIYILEKKFSSLKLKNKKKIQKIKLRLENEIDKEYKFSLEEIITSFLPILDSLEIAYETIMKSKNNIQEISQKLLENNKLFLKIFSENNVSLIKDKNVLFDPSIHQAMFLKKSKTVKKNYVIEIFQKGYLLHNRLLRAAIVSVST